MFQFQDSSHLSFMWHQLPVSLVISAYSASYVHFPRPDIALQMSYDSSKL